MRLINPTLVRMKTSAVKILIAVNVVVYVLQGSGRLPLGWLALWPLSEAGEPGNFRLWQLITYAFLHGSFSHLAFNMLGLWMFGAEIERYITEKRFTLLYFASVFTAAITQLFVPVLFHTEPAPTVGASGGVFGLLLAYALLFPHRKVVPLIPPIPMPAWLFATSYAGLELFLGVTGSQSSVAHFAHLGGMIGSAAVMLGSRAIPFRSNRARDGRSRPESRWP